MSQSIPAIYENGTLRLLEPVELEEGQQVQIHIVESDKWAKLREIFGDSAQLPTPLPEDDHITRQIIKNLEEEVRKAFSVGKPLSEMIIEDRGEI